MRVAFTNSEIIGKGDIPLYGSVNGNKLLTIHQEIAHRVALVYDDSDACCYVRDIWSLCKAFWADLEDNVTTRKDLFSEW